MRVPDDDSVQSVQSVVREMHTTGIPEFNESLLLFIIDPTFACGEYESVKNQVLSSQKSELCEKPLFSQTLTPKGCHTHVPHTTKQQQNDKILWDCPMWELKLKAMPHSVTWLWCSHKHRNSYA